ncbi:MAG: hypothetical protein AAGC85_09860 [Bacteroidota bacterium]
MKSVVQTLLLLLILLGCKNPSRENILGEESEHDTVVSGTQVDNKETKPNASILSSKPLIEKGFIKLSIEDYFFENLIISKIGKLKGINSLSITGYSVYTFDGKENIIRREDITNNFVVYSYDMKGRLLEFEVKQHTTQEAYYTESYRYSSQDSVIEIIKTSSRESEPVEKEVINDSIFLNAEAVKARFFKSRTPYDYYINQEIGKIITYEDKMVFCCGVIMDGKNKLTYHFNEAEMIDSLVIEGLETKERMRFRYEYSY